jgi:Ca-activated chloride channel family protein
MAIVLDSSGSMRDAMPEVHQAAASFVETLRPQDRALVIDFDDKVFLLQELTSDQVLLKEAVGSTEALGSTALYDALHAAFRKLRGIEGRKAIVLLSDGDDTSSQFAYARILEEAKAQSVLLYAIGLGDVRKSVLKEFSETTGGRAFFVGKASELAEVYRKIAEELRRQYYLSYATNNTKWDGRFIKLEVKSKNPDWSVRARRGYFAVRSGVGSTAPK